MTHQPFASSNDVVARSSINERMVPNIHLIWLDNSIDKNSVNYRKAITQFRRLVNIIETFTDSDQCLDFLTDICNENVILIISDTLCESTVPLIHDVTQLHTIFIFCENKARYERWAEGWSKIKGVFTQITSICQRLEKVARECEQNAISISFVDTSGDLANKRLDQLDPSFMYTQILKEILLTIDFKEEHMKEFIAFCRNKFNDKITLLDIKRFESQYPDKTSIYWYSSVYFLYQMLNSALRTMDVKIIINMGFFISDLHHHIEQLHLQQFTENHSGTSFIVYRGQGLSKIDFEQMVKTKDGLLSFNSFLSTSTDRDVSLAFAESQLENPDLVGILFVMTIEPLKSTTPFASISSISGYKEESEVLFSMHSIFRIQDITPMGENQRLYQVNLTLTSDKDNDLCVLTKRIREETFPNSIGWDRLGQVLLIMGQSDEAQQIYDMLLEQPTNESGQASIYHQLGVVKYDQGKYQEALKYYEKSLAIRQKCLLPNHPDLATSYNNIGNVYSSTGEYSKALSFHQKALEIQERLLPSNHPDLAKYYNNIGALYNIMKNDSKALWFHEKALEIRQQSLPSHHPDLARSYSNVGAVYDNMKKYLKALSSHEKALEIRQRSLPSNHPDLAKSYNDIGNVHGRMLESSKALLSFEKALEIQQKSLPPNHPELAKTYSNIGLVYEIMANYSKAHSYYKRAVDIGKDSLPSNHPNMKLFKNNIDRVKKKL